MSDRRRRRRLIVASSGDREHVRVVEELLDEHADARRRRLLQLGRWAA